MWPRHKAREALRAQHLGDTGPVERRIGPLERLGDLERRETLQAKLDDRVAGRVLGRSTHRPGTRQREEPRLSRPEVAHRRAQRLDRPADTPGGLGCRDPLVEEGTQPLEAAMLRARREGEELPARTRRCAHRSGRSRRLAHGVEHSTSPPRGHTFPASRSSYAGVTGISD